jgi:hypothetical protein
MYRHDRTEATGSAESRVGRCVVADGAELVQGTTPPASPGGRVTVSGISGTDPGSLTPDGRPRRDMGDLTPVAFDIETSGLDDDALAAIDDYLA